MDVQGNEEDSGVRITAFESMSVMRDTSWDTRACASTPVAISCLVDMIVPSMFPESAIESKLTSLSCGARPTCMEKR